MARLYYEKGDSAADAAVDSELKNYGEKIGKLIPSEVIAGYLTMLGFVPLSGDTAKPWLYLAAFFLCLILTPLYLRAMSDPFRPKRRHLVISSLAFVVWAYTISGQAVIPAYYQPAVASMIMVAFTLISGVVPLNK